MQLKLFCSICGRDISDETQAVLVLLKDKKNTDLICLPCSKKLYNNKQMVDDTIIVEIGAANG